MPWNEYLHIPLQVSTEIMTEHEVDLNSNDTQSHQRLASSPTQCKASDQTPSLSSSTIQPDINGPVTSPFPSRTHKLSSNVAKSKAPQPVVSSSSYSTMHPRAPSPAALYQSSSTVQTKASFPSFSMAHSRTSTATDSGDWDMGE